MSSLLKPDPSYVLMKAFSNACLDLGLGVDEQSKLLGINRTTIKRNSAGFSPDSKTGEIQLSFVRLYRSLFAIAGGDIEFMRHWFATENRALNGAPNQLCTKIEGLFRINQYLDAMRGKI